MAQAVFPPDPVENIVEQQILLQRPEVKKMADMDKAMADLLSRTDLNDAARLREYMNIFAKFRSLRDDVIVNGTVLDPKMFSISSILGDKDTTARIADEVNTLVTKPEVLPKSPNTSYDLNLYDLFNDTPNYYPNEGATSTPFNGSPEPIDKQYDTVIRGLSESQLMKLDTAPQEELTNAFLNAIKTSKLKERDDGKIFIPINSNEYEFEKEITKDISAIVKYLAEGKPLSKKNKSIFKTLRPFMTHAIPMYNELTKKLNIIDENQFTPPLNKKRKQIVASTGSAIRENDQRFRLGRDKRRLLWNKWDKKIRSQT